jgi:hypothetical protein
MAREDAGEFKAPAGRHNSSGTRARLRESNVEILRLSLSDGLRMTPWEPRRGAGTRSHNVVRHARNKSGNNAYC